MTKQNNTTAVNVLNHEENRKENQTEEIISSGGRLIAYIVRNHYRPKNTHFITPSHLNHQIGFIVHEKGGVIKRHEHRQLERQIFTTQEVLLVRLGELEVERRVLEEGDVLILVNGGHGFRMLKHTVLLEIKQGPYMGVQEKEYF